MLKKENYTKSVYRPYAPFYTNLILTGMASDINFRPYLKEKFVYKNIVIPQAIWYYQKQEWAHLIDLVFREWQNRTNLKKAIKAFKIQENRLIRAAKGKNLANFAREYRAYMPSVATIWIIEDKVLEALQKRLPLELLNRLSFPLKDNYYKKEEYDLVKTRDIKSHVKEYEWKNSHYGEIHPYTLVQARARIKTINKKEFLKEYHQSKVEIRRAIVEAKKIMGKNNNLVDLLQFILYYRTQRTDIINKAAYLFAPELKIIARRLGLTYKQAIYCTAEELLGQLPSLKTINQRMKCHVSALISGQIYILIGADAAKINKIFAEKVLQIKKLSGQPASKGLITGRAKIVFSKKDYSKVNSGDILITHMTTPAMVPVMKKASAFVTDEGGITCHAAIISREMKKPCVIGTRIATKFLKDGDIIEVDANRGVVRKLNK